MNRREQEERHDKHVALVVSAVYIFSISIIMGYLFNDLMSGAVIGAMLWLYLFID